jgi:hypothetical protein
LTLGKATNPPTRAVTITLTIPAAKGGAATKKKPAKATTIGKATITIPTKKTRPLTVKLNATGRSLLRHHAKLTITATLVATATDGTKQTRVRKLTVKRRRASH